jgi:hypothetical protein
MNTAGTNGSPTTDADRDPGRTRSLTPARVMFAVDAVTAGALGAGMLAAPEPVGKLLFGAAQDPLAARMVGAVWTGFGAVSAAGVRDPDRHLPLFLAQAAYKSLWLATSLSALRARPAAAGMAASFVVYLAGYALALSRGGWPSRRRYRIGR